MLALSALSSLLLASSTIALTTPHRRTSSGCSAFPVNGVPDVPNFTLLAQSTADASVQEPLVLVAHTPSLTLSYLATADSISTASPLGSTFSMASSGITAHTANNGSAVSVDVGSSNAFLQFVSLTSAPPAEDYCELVNTDPNGSPYAYPVLAVNGDSGSFFLCDSGSNSERLVVFNPEQASATTFVFDTCDKVDILIVQ
ncbi:hypothetical protein OF83DRAFT_1087419 [Amylostereum chailletii]|nr:hypothetical protein OF83DRAFT_1087419 [Amylostereum chailletii]